MKYAVALGAIFLLYVASNYWVLSESQIAHFYDESCRIRMGADVFFHASSHIDLPGFARLVFQLDAGQAHPHFFEVVEAISWKLLGGAKDGTIWEMVLLTHAFFWRFC